MEAELPDVGRVDILAKDMTSGATITTTPWRAVIFPSATDMDFPFHLSSEPTATVSPEQFEDVSDTVNTVGELLDIIRDIKARYATHREELVVYFRVSRIVGGLSVRRWYDTYPTLAPRFYSGTKNNR